jgi:hypothetical protein
VTSLLKNLEGRRLADTDRAEEDSTGAWKRRAEQLFRDLFASPNCPQSGMIYLRLRLAPGQYEQLEDYFNEHGYDLNFSWIR